jgi:hypothetical protein
VSAARAEADIKFNCGRTLAASLQRLHEMGSL